MAVAPWNLLMYGCRQKPTRNWMGWAASILVVICAGCHSLKLPAIDPTGSRIFLPHSYKTTPLWPAKTQSPGTKGLLHGSLHRGKSKPAFSHPQAQTAAAQTPAPPKHISAKLGGFHHKRGREGEIILTPSRIIAPVNSEVVILSGICGGDGYYVINQPLEWMLTSDSVGHIVEVGGTEHPEFNKLVPPSSKKFDGQYAWGRTALKEKTLTRGTPTTVDDLQIDKGQHYITLSSPSPGTSYITCVAPKAEAWDRRKATTRVHWVDAVWSIPVPTRATAGQPFTLNTRITRASDGSPVVGYKVQYRIVGGAPAEFLPTAAQTATVTTTAEGTAPVEIRQPASQTTAGTTQIQVDVLQPGGGSEPDVLLESGLTQIQWSAPALTIRAIGPQTAGLDQPFNYRLEVTNPGDQLARNVIVRSRDLNADVQYISSEPKPAQYGDQYQWNLGDLPPGSPAKIVDVQLKSSVKGQQEICFQVASETDQLRTEACAKTMIAPPCIGLQINGPNTGQVGTDAFYNFEIINQCDQPLTNLRLRVSYDEGLQATGLGNPIQTTVASIPPGGRESIDVQFSVVAPGARCFTLDVVADGGHTASARRCLEVSQVVAPDLKVDIVAEPMAAAVGQPVLVRMTIANTGNVPLSNVSVLNQFSPSLTVARATGPSDNLTRNYIGDDFAFNILRLEPQSQQVLEIEFQGAQADANAFSRIVVTTALGANATKTVPIRIEGIPVGAGGAAPSIPAAPAANRLAVDVATIASPIRAGVESRAFEVRIVNNSAQPLENVGITLAFPSGLQFGRVESAEGALPVTGRSPDGSQIALEPRRVLRAGEQVRFAVSVIGTLPGRPLLEVTAESPTVAVASDRDAVEITN